MEFGIRDYRSDDADAVNRVALAAFHEYKWAYSDWPAFSHNIGNMSALSEHGQVIVATQGHEIAGAVVYVGPGKPKSHIFDQEWPIMRMLVVAPEKRGLGMGRALTEECICRARREASSVIALHTTEIMEVALGLYTRMGFEFHRKAPEIWVCPTGFI